MFDNICIRHMAIIMMKATQHFTRRLWLKDTAARASTLPQEKLRTF
jgi:hypothetical protein